MSGRFVDLSIYLENDVHSGHGERRDTAASARSAIDSEGQHPLYC